MTNCVGWYGIDRNTSKPSEPTNPSQPMITGFVMGRLAIGGDYSYCLDSTYFAVFLC